MPVPQFFVPHPIIGGETLSMIAAKHRFGNPGPIIAFNADRLPGAVETTGEKRELTPEFIDHNKRMKNMGDGPQNPNYPTAWKPMGANQITDAVLRLNNPAMGAGRVITVRSEYPISQPVDPQVGFLEIPWTRKALREYVRVLNDMIAEIIRDTNLAVNGQTAALKELKTTFIAADLVFAVISAPLMAAQEWKIASTAIANGKKVGFLLEDVLPILAEKAMQLGNVAWDVAQAEQLKSAALNKMPARIKVEKDLDYFIDNYLAFVSPSRIATWLVGVTTGDTDMMRYGEAVVDARTKNKIIDEGQKQIDRMQGYISIAQMAMSASFYDHIVRDAAPMPVSVPAPQRPRSPNMCAQQPSRFHGTPVSSGPFPRFRGR